MTAWLGGAAVALFEPLVRATGRDEDALARVASLMEQLREIPNGDELIPDGFDELWTSSGRYTRSDWHEARTPD